MRYKGLTGFFNKTVASLASILKVSLLSRGSSPSLPAQDSELIVLGNGPSLRNTLDTEMEWLQKHTLMCVNFAALSPDFIKLRPRYYVLADGHFFNAYASDSNVRTLWENLGKANWPITLLIPSKFRDLAKPLIPNKSDLNLRFFNLTPVEGIKWLNYLLFKSGRGMPRPRNVLIPAIMEGIRLGYRKIYLCGADHSWTKTLDVDDENFVISVQPHFYSDNAEEHRRVRETYKNLRLHDVLESMTIAFRSYWEIADYAKRRKVEIINATPGSMIDAFPRR